jgi:hypothetical protein
MVEFENILRVKFERENSIKILILSNISKTHSFICIPTSHPNWLIFPGSNQNNKVVLHVETRTVYIMSSLSSDLAFLIQLVSAYHLKAN